MNPKAEKDKTITFSLREEDRDRERHAMLRAVYDALSERGYNPLVQIVGYILTEDPTYITNHKNARAIMSKIDRDDLMFALLKEYLGI
ncbi:MAG: IreB family regulatory phosphoprotein [Clostridia bacterium]|nr:IreB family regulatory phosphoprotein [Clostridia bacterium]